MEVRRAVWLLVFAPLGCNALTGADELELVDCVDCVEAGRDTSVPGDTGSASEVSVEDTGALDTSVDPPVDTAPALDTAPADVGCTSDASCDDGNACTTDSCNVVTGVCAHKVIDNDGDGESPTNLGACGTDCNDNNPSVFSKQTAFFTTAYATESGAKSFDYNCDGVSEKQYPALTVCKEVSGTCTEATSGWDSTVPACGGLAKRAICIKLFSCARGTASDATAQPCR